MSNLVERLRAEQPIVASLRPESTAEALKAALKRGLVHVKFINTRGGTELGVRIDPEASDLRNADFASARGTLTLVGDLELDFIPVRFRGALALDTLEGTGRLEPITAPAPPDPKSGS
jgi:hypothetical protein